MPWLNTPHHNRLLHSSSPRSADAPPLQLATADDVLSGHTETGRSRQHGLLTLSRNNSYLFSLLSFFTPCQCSSALLLSCRNELLSPPVLSCCFVLLLCSRPSSVLSSVLFFPPQARHNSHAAMAPASALRLPNSAIFVCDIQEKFRNAIHEFDKVYVPRPDLFFLSSSLSLVCFFC